MKKCHCCNKKSESLQEISTLNSKMGKICDPCFEVMNESEVGYNLLSIQIEKNLVYK